MKIYELHSLLWYYPFNQESSKNVKWSKHQIKSEKNRPGKVEFVHYVLDYFYSVFIVKRVEWTYRKYQESQEFWPMLKNENKPKVLSIKLNLPNVFLFLNFLLLYSIAGLQIKLYKNVLIFWLIEKILKQVY